MFDDTFRHEAWNPSHDTTRIVLMLDIEYDGGSEERNQEFFETSKRQLYVLQMNENYFEFFLKNVIHCDINTFRELYGSDALISRDLIDALTSYGAQENSNFKERPPKYT